MALSGSMHSLHGLRGLLVAQSFTVNLDFGSHRIEDITLHWGLRQGSDTRREAPAWGTDIEVPAVLELLDLIAAEEITPDQARDKLNRLATAISEQMNREWDEMIERMEKPAPPAVPKKIRLDARWVYAISTDDTPGSIKIGVATDIAQRVKSLQGGSAATLKLRWSARGGFPLERHLHEKFDVKRTHGEWFDFKGHPDPIQEINETALTFLQQYAKEGGTNL